MRQLLNKHRFKQVRHPISSNGMLQQARPDVLLKVLNALHILLGFLNPGYDCRTLNIILANLFRQRVERVKSHFLKWPNVKQKQSSSPKPDYSWTDRLRIIKWLQLSGSLDLFNTSDAHRQTAKRVARCFPREATPTKTLFLFRYSPGLSRVSTINHWVGEIDLVQSPRDKKEKTTHP